MSLSSSRDSLPNAAISRIRVQVLLVISLDRPPWDGQMATRFLVSAEAADLPVTVVLNKADLVSEERRQEILQLVGIPPKRVQNMAIGM